jgi:hypothetical protein
MKRSVSDSSRETDQQIRTDCTQYCPDACVWNGTVMKGTAFFNYCAIFLMLRTLIFSFLSTLPIFVFIIAVYERYSASRPRPSSRRSLETSTRQELPRTASSQRQHHCRTPTSLIQRHRKCLGRLWLPRWIYCNHV